MQVLIIQVRSYTIPRDFHQDPLELIFLLAGWASLCVGLAIWRYPYEDYIY